MGRTTPFTQSTVPHLQPSLQPQEFRPPRRTMLPSWRRMSSGREYSKRGVGVRELSPAIGPFTARESVRSVTNTSHRAAKMAVKMSVRSCDRAWNLSGIGQVVAKGEMTFQQAGIAVLRQANRAMTAEEITQEAVDRGLVSSGGKTPARTMNSMLYVTARSPRNPGIRRLFVPGRGRAKRGTVRWRWEPDEKQVSTNP